MQTPVAILRPPPDAPLKAECNRGQHCVCSVDLAFHLYWGQCPYFGAFMLHLHQTTPNKQKDLKILTWHTPIPTKWETCIPVGKEAKGGPHQIQGSGMSLAYHLSCRFVKQKILRQLQNRDAFDADSLKKKHGTTVTPKSPSLPGPNSLQHLSLLRRIKGPPLSPFHPELPSRMGSGESCQQNVPRWWHLKGLQGADKGPDPCSKMYPEERARTLHVQSDLSKSRDKAVSVTQPPWCDKAQPPWCFPQKIYAPLLRPTKSMAWRASRALCSSLLRQALGPAQLNASQIPSCLGQQVDTAVFLMPSPQNPALSQRRIL